MKELRRTEVDKFKIEDGISLEEVKNSPQIAETKIISIEKIFIENEKMDLNERKLELFLNGVMLTYEQPDGIYRIYNKNKFIGLGIVKNNLLKRDVII